MIAINKAYPLSYPLLGLLFSYRLLMVASKLECLRQMTLATCTHKIRDWELKGAPVDSESLIDLSNSMNSYLGMLRQVNGYSARKSLCSRVESLFLSADSDCTKILPKS